MIVYLALGSNVGNREAYLNAAISGLRGRGVRPIATASIYSTEPKDIQDQPWFLNTVMEAETFLEPLELLDVCLSIEKQNSRVREKKNGPRTLDIDIIFYGELVLHRPGLVVPHPR